MLGIPEVIEQSRRHSSTCPSGIELVSVLDCQGTACFVSDEHMKVLGFCPAELQGTCVFEKVHPDDITRVQDRFNHMIQTTEPTVVEFRFQHKAHPQMWVHIRAEGTPIITDGVVDGFMIVSREQTVDLLSLMKAVDFQHTLSLGMR